MKRSSDTANTEVMDVVTDIAKKMEAMVSSAAMLRDLEEKPDRIRDEVAQAEREKHARMAEFDRKMEEHEMMTIQSVLQRQNKVSIDSEEYKELQMLQVKENKEEQERKKRKFDDELEERAKTELRLKELEFAKKMAEARAQETSFATERNMLYMTIEGLRAEIESQKALTSELAASR
ncbi:hypothetical protein DIPPA_29954 [Diplonema papillatum]|nr:hypothetical protein DIPPA_29954 [Diplonema papillatum]